MTEYILTPTNGDIGKPKRIIEVKPRRRAPAPVEPSPPPLRQPEPAAPAPQKPDRELVPA